MCQRLNSSFLEEERGWRYWLPSSGSWRPYFGSDSAVQPQLNKTAGESAALEKSTDLGESADLIEQAAESEYSWFYSYNAIKKSVGTLIFKSV